MIRMILSITNSLLRRRTVWLTTSGEIGETLPIIAQFSEKAFRTGAADPSAVRALLPDAIGDRG